MGNYRIGQIVVGEVTGIQPYGAFVQLDRNTQGLIHISECRSAYIQHVADELKVGQTIDVMVMDIDLYSGKISLSRRAVLEKERRGGFDTPSKGMKQHHHYWTNQRLPIGFETIAVNKPAMVSEALERLK